jgi:hypothetical protein
MKRNGIDTACRKHGRQLRTLIENPKARDSLQKLAIDDRKIIRWILTSRV